MFQDASWVLVCGCAGRSPKCFFLTDLYVDPCVSAGVVVIWQMLCFHAFHSEFEAKEKLLPSSFFTEFGQCVLKQCQHCLCPMQA